MRNINHNVRRSKNVKLRTALFIFLASMLTFDLVSILILDAVGSPVTVSVPVLGMDLGQNYVIVALLIIFPVAVMEMFFISWFIDRKRMWN